MGFDSRHWLKSTMSGTPALMPPEALCAKQHYYDKLDMPSTEVLITQIITHHSSSSESPTSKIVIPIQDIERHIQKQTQA